MTNVWSEIYWWNDLLLLAAGSMRGDRIEATQAALLVFLKSLPTGCYFNIVGFGSSFALLFPEYELLCNLRSLLEHSCCLLTSVWCIPGTVPNGFPVVSWGLNAEANPVKLNQKLSNYKQITRKLCIQYVESICSNSVTFKSTLGIALRSLEMAPFDRLHISSY